MRRYGLIGRSLTHSSSARYFAEKFEHEGLEECCYDLYELSSIEELPHMLSILPDLQGFNVTIPYKELIIPYLDELSNQAQQVGAVNCVCREGGRLVGYNTDVDGLRATIIDFCGANYPENALVLGTGGASLAVQYVLSEFGVTFELVSRDPLKGNYTYDNLPCEVVASHHLIINTSPVGMYPNVDEAPRIPYAYVTPDHYLLDLVYNPQQTQFLDYGLQRGARICNGEQMLREQAEAAWMIWNK